MVPQVATGLLTLLEEDPELGAGLAPEEFAEAERLLRVPALTVDVGAWDIRAALGEPSLGLLVIEGLVTVNTGLSDRVSSQLAGPGDILHMATAPDYFVPAMMRHFVSERARLAVLDRHFIAAVRRWPALLLSLHERLRVQEHRLAIQAAISKQRRVDDRILALVWHLAERWGRVTAEGVVVPLALTHETIGRLVGAERPTVTLALRDLATAGDLVRRDDGAFLLRGDSKDRLRPVDEARPQVRPLRVVRAPDTIAMPDLTPGIRSPMIDIVALRKRIAALHEDLPRRVRTVDELLELSRRTAERNRQARAAVAAVRERYLRN